jgi:uncharacterized membrane protein
MPFLFNICYLKFLISFVLFINHLFWVQLFKRSRKNKKK